MQGTYKHGNITQTKHPKELVILMKITLSSQFKHVVSISEERLCLLSTEK